MKLTSREKKLLVALGAMLFIWVYYKFVLLSQITMLKAKEQDKINYETELNKMKTIVASENDIDLKFIDINNELERLSKKYFLKIDQSQLIILINEFLEGTDLFVENLSFSPPRKEGVGELQLEVMSVALPYEGEYSSLLLFLEKIRKHDRKVIIQNLDIKTNEDKLLLGSILLDFYSLPYLIDVENNNTALLFDTSEINLDPFNSIEDDFFIEEDNYEAIDLTNIKIELNNTRIILVDFENKVLDFIPSHLSIKGEVMLNKNAKQGDKSLGLYYSFPPIQDKKHIYISLVDSNIIISQPPESIGLWVYSYDNTKHGLKLRGKDKNGKKLDVILSEEINWIGWKHLKTEMPKDNSIYPIQIEGIIVDIESPNQGKGTLLFDALETFYPLEIVDTTDNNINSDYQFYDVEIGDTLTIISKHFYKDKSKQDIIKKYNNIKNDRDLKPGKTIIIPKI